MHSLNSFNDRRKAVLPSEKAAIAKRDRVERQTPMRSVPENNQNDYKGTDFSIPGPDVYKAHEY